MTHTNFNSAYEKLSSKLNFSLPLPTLQKNVLKIKQCADTMFQYTYFKTLNITEILLKANTVSQQIYR